MLRPRILLLLESELWPTVIRLTKARGVPVAVVNGRLSARAFSRYQWVRPVVGTMLSRVDLFLMQSQTDADRLLELGVRAERVQVAGNLKWDASLNVRPEPEAIRRLAARLGLTDQKVLVAGSTHRGEEAVVLDAYRLLRATHPDLRCILAPRHLERLEEVESMVRQAGWKSVRLSLASSGAWDVGLVDTFGQLSLYYGLATLVFIGGSLIPHGGQNPLEATSLGKPVVFGPFMHNFESIVHQLLAYHAARQMTLGEPLTPLLAELLEHPAETAAMSRRAREVTEQFQGATQRTLEALQPLLGNR